MIKILKKKKTNHDVNDKINNIVVIKNDNIKIIIYFYRNKFY